jgi:uncharacterized protein with FMN-binding domain
MPGSLPLPRLVTVVLVTVVAAALVASFRVTPHVQKGRLAAVHPGRGASHAAAPPTHAGAPSPHRTSSSHAASQKAAPPAVRKVSGAPVMTPYGTVQVRVTLRGGRIVSITNLALPFDRSHSQELSQVAGPLLRSEALKAQSANIDVVSGATYTSDGYAQSLQSALDKAHA